jgi:cytoskeletal protein CcmA (bactofilin family)
MFPPKSRDGGAANGDATEPESSAEGGASLNEERLSHLQPKYPDHGTSGRSTASSTAPVGEDPGALLIGGGVELKGRIGSCDSLVVEGTIESTIECRSIEVRASGVVTGEATVENATIVGRFDGNLVVTGCLTLQAGGRISGSVRYGEIEIERGAEIAGDVAKVGSEAPGVSASATEYAVSPQDSTTEELEARVKAL